MCEKEVKGKTYLKTRNEFLFLYDIKMGNPNGDPVENRPRVLPDNTYYVTDVRLKRFIRDYLKQKGNDILVDKIDEKTTNLTGRVADYLDKNDKKLASGNEIVDIILDSFIDARLFGSSLAFKEMKLNKKNWKPEPIPKTLTGPIQINMGEVLHDADEITIHGTTTFASDSEKTQGTFTEFYGLRYALIGFSGVANENSARLSRLSEDDYKLFLISLWKSIRESANTRSKKGQIPHLLINIEYKEGQEFQFGRLQDYVKTEATNGKEEKLWKGTVDFKVKMGDLIRKIDKHKGKIEKITYEISDDISLDSEIPDDWVKLEIDKDISVSQKE